MTVKELKRIVDQCDEDATVLIDTGAVNYSEAEDVVETPEMEYVIIR